MQARDTLQRLGFQTDGRPHPKENAAIAGTVVFALVSIVCAFFPGMHLLGSWTGLLGVLLGFGAQMMSATTAERTVNVIALGTAAVGLAMGLAHGGLY
jgi:hypothetical protein